MLPSRLGSLPAALIVLLAAACGPPDGEREGAEPVQLIVLISVDQFPVYLFQRYDSLYSGGLRRLLEEGRSYTNAVHDHALTWTSAGHATLSTGVAPARHGVVANSWYEEVEGEWKRVGSVDDEGESIPGVPDKRGISPRNLRVSGLADWIVATDPQSRIVSISGKRTASVLLAGRTRAGHVYYFEDDVGRFVSSTYYRDPHPHPEWLERFNDEVLAGFFADSVWECTVPLGRRALARRDNAPYENYGANTSFPHRFAAEAAAGGDPEAYYDWWDHTPELDRATLALAREAVSSLSLGTRGHVDYLAIGLSQLDRVGHDFGPLSLEQLDALLRLDRQLAGFLAFLDDAVGKDRYVVALTSDHGVVEIPDYRRELGEPGKHIAAREIRAVHQTAIEADQAAGSPADRRSAVIRALKELDFIADVMTLEQLVGPESSDSFVALYQRSYYPGRVPGVLAKQGLVVRLTEGSHGGPEMTTHGSPYLYDRHVPLIFMGPGIRAGSSSDAVHTTDVAPTLARLAGISFPAGLDGRPLIEETD